MISIIRKNHYAFDKKTQRKIYLVNIIYIILSSRKLDLVCSIMKAAHENIIIFKYIIIIVYQFKYIILTIKIKKWTRKMFTENTVHL